MTFSFGLGRTRETSLAGNKGPALRRYGLNFNIDVNNVFNHLNPGGFVGNPGIAAVRAVDSD